MINKEKDNNSTISQIINDLRRINYYFIISSPYLWQFFENIEKIAIDMGIYNILKKDISFDKKIIWKSLLLKEVLTFLFKYIMFFPHLVLSLIGFIIFIWYYYIIF